MPINELISDQISKEEFLNVYNKHLPNKWIKFVFRYFSQTTFEKDKWLSLIVTGILFTLFILGFFGTVLKLNEIFIFAVTIPFIIILLGVSILMFGSFVMNNLRIRKIRKKLGLTKTEYNLLVMIYLS